jgi:hypothetical protein
MRPWLRFGPLAAVLLLSLKPDPVLAALQRHLQTTGTSSGTGVITIETFDKPIVPRNLNPRSPAVLTTVTCTIPPGFSAAQTTSTLRDSLDHQLPPTYAASICPTDPTVVILHYSVKDATFTMNVMETIPGQTVVEIPPTCIPTLSEWGVILLGLLIAASGVLILRRRGAFVRAT